MAKRRTAEEAFQMPGVVMEFIDRGVAPENAAPKASEAGEERVIELAPERGERQLPRPSDELTRTYAKATVQKTIRFHPKLIAELETYVRSQETRGEKPTPFQQIQNEALELWLEKNVRHSL